jgi:hypothetical protein
MKDSDPINQKVDETITRLTEGKIGIEEAVSNLLSDAGLKVGAKVAVIDDPTFPYAGQRGVVRKVNEGMADVEFPNGTVVPLQISLLVTI